MDDLRTFIGALDRAGELRRIRARVSPVLEIAAIADRVSKSACPSLPGRSAKETDPRFHGLGGPALLFENVEGSDTPVLINALGSYRRMEMALACARFRTPDADGLEAIAHRIGALVKPEPPKSLREAVRKAKQFGPLLRIAPKRSRKPGPCQEVVVEGDAVDLTALPMLRCWPHDGDYESLGYPGGVNDAVPGLGHPGIDPGAWESSYRGRYITLGGVHTISAEDAESPKPSSHNIGMYRVQLLGKRTMAMHWHVHHDGASHWRSWKARDEPMPVAIALGGEPVLPYAATAPLPPGISELLMAGFLHGSGIRLCRARTVPLWVPANAEIVIEGYVSDQAGEIGWDPRSGGEALGPGAVFEGPFGDHTGFYSMPDRYPVLMVTAVTSRRTPIYPTTIVGLPPQEDYFLGKTTERLFLPLLRTLIHDIEDYDLPMFGAFHNAAFLRISKAYPLQARRVMHAVWGAGQMAWTKLLFVVGQGVDVHDTLSVLRAASERCRPDRDLEMVRGPLDILDHAAPMLGAGSKLGFDCTERQPGEGAGHPDADARPWTIPDAPTRRATLDRILAIDGVTDASWPEACGGWIFVCAHTRHPGDAQHVAMACLEAARDLAPFVVLVGPGVDCHDPDRAMFHLCANADPGRDLYRSTRGPSIALDATPKSADDRSRREPVREWPPIIEMAPEIVDLVDRRWDEYGLGDLAATAQSSP